MKTFNEFINEGQHFLRSIGKNDKVVGDKKPAKDLEVGDWFWHCGPGYGNTGHYQITCIKKFNAKYVDLLFDRRSELHKTQMPSFRFWFNNSQIDEYTCSSGRWITTTDEDAFLEFKEKYYPNVEIVECPAN